MPSASSAAGAIPASPPASVLAEVRAAYLRTGELEQLGIRVDFDRDPDDGGLLIALRSARGEHRLRPSQVFDLLDRPLVS
jgi:hypothetical protein